MNAVDQAKNLVRHALAEGSVRDIDRAYEQLHRAERMASMRRSSTSCLRIATKIFSTTDLSWERFSHQVETFRK